MERIDRIPLREQVAIAIRKAILTGEFRPGDKIPELELAERLGVSRSPVREALYALEQRGLVVNSLNNGTYVVSLSPEELLDGQRLRAVIEEFAVQQALERSRPHEWDKFCAQQAQIIERMREATDQGSPIAVTELDVESHERLVDAAKNSMLSHTWRSLGLPMRVWLVERVSDALIDYWQATVENHEKLLTALRSRDPDRCREAIRAHILSAEIVMQR